ncbi:MAG: hypothetical protein AAFV29_15100, partial [Myxococcota bacterium]
GHGTPAEGDRPAGLELWGSDNRVTPEALAEILDERRRGMTAFVLGQCHSGAFADLSWLGAKTEGPVAFPARCVFAAVPADREASGCTADLTDASAKSYVSQFARALATPDADFDRDQKVSLAEAHAFARIHDPTINVPISSTEIWLELAVGTTPPDAQSVDLRKLLKTANPAEAAVLAALGPQYVALADGARVAERDYAASQQKLEQEQKRFEGLQNEFENARRKLMDGLLAQWPELTNPYHPVSRALLAGPAPMIVEWLQKQDGLRQLERLDDALGKLDTTLLAAEKKAARQERWFRALQIVANAAWLRQNRRSTKELEALRACEALIPHP